MATQYTLTPATPADAPQIALIYSKSWVSPFTALQFNHASPSQIASIMTPRVAKEMATPHTQWLVMRYRNPASEEEVAAVASWTVPHNEENADESPEDGEERAQFEDEVARKEMPESWNRDLVIEFRGGLRRLRGRVLRGRRYYALDNIATHPEHRGKGLASQLVGWGTSRADAEGLVTYLETASDNPAKGMYTKMGFEELDECSVIEDLSKFGGEGSHTHVAFMRQPRNVA